MNQLKSNTATGRQPPQRASAASPSRLLSLDDRAGRFASALLLLAALVLAVDVGKAALYGWYSQGSFLRYSLGGDEATWTGGASGAGPGATQGGAGGAWSAAEPPKWPRCGPAGAGPAPSPTQRPLSAPSDTEAVEDLSQRRRVLRSPAAAPVWLNDARDAATFGVHLVSGLLSGYRPAPRSLVRVLSHASSAACLLMLLAAVLPVRLRLLTRSASSATRSPTLTADGWPQVSPCPIVLSLGVAAGASALGLVSISACIVKVYLLALCEVSQAARLTYTFVTACPILRKASFCAECFCLLLLTAASCLTLCLCVFYCRAVMGDRGRRGSGGRSGGRWSGGAGGKGYVAAAASEMEQHLQRQHRDELMSQMMTQQEQQGQQQSDEFQLQRKKVRDAGYCLVPGSGMSLGDGEMMQVQGQQRRVFAVPVTATATGVGAATLTRIPAAADYNCQPIDEREYYLTYR